MPSELVWCETLYSNGVETFNTLSCFIYIFFGIYIILKSKRSSKYIGFGILSIWLGVTSIVLHTTKSEFGLILDLSSMVLLSTYVVLEFVVDWTIVRERLIYLSYGILLLISLVLNTSLLLIFFFAAISLLGVIVGAAKKREFINIKYLGIGVILFAFGYLFWIGDYTKIYCPSDVLFINGHTIWHLLTAGATFCLYRALKLKDISYNN